MPAASHTRIVLAAVLALALASGAATGCARSGATVSGELAATGTVIADTVAVPVPTLAVPSPDVTVGFPSAGLGGALPVAGSRSQVATVAAAVSLGKRARVASMAVETGSVVRAGDVLGTMDGSLLAASVESARAAAAQARANRDLLGDRLNTLNSKGDTLVTTRAKLVKTIADLEKMRAQIASQLAAAKDALAKLEAAMAARASMPRSAVPTRSAVPSGSVPPGGSLPPGVTLPGGKLPDPAALRAGIAKMTAGLAKLDAGLAKAKAGLAKLDSAKVKLSDARTTLRSTRPLADVAVDLADTGVELAQARLSDATVYAPCDGAVLSAARAGDVLAPGAPLVTLRPARASRVQLWLEGSELEGVAVGKTASVRIDSLPDEVFSAKVTLVGVEYGFPPTSLATQIIHLTRAVPVQVTLDDGKTIPPGTPADVTISTR